MFYDLTPPYQQTLPDLNTNVLVPPKPLIPEMQTVENEIVMNNVGIDLETQ